MGVFGPVIEALVLPMLDPGHDLPLGSGVALQLVSDEHTRGSTLLLEELRLATTRGDQKAVIEVKIADKRWSLTDLARALRTQLVDRYLRHDSCKAGYLLLTYHGTKKYWQHPETRRRLGFAEILKYLASFAEDIEQERGYSVCLAVRGLDLTDPVTAK
jgi:hypothetical protein